MGKSILTPRQSDFLELAKKDQWLTKYFFLGGGTALSEFYLRHRVSEDLDFFSDQEIRERSIRAFLKKISSELEIKDFEIKESFGFQICLLKFV